MLENKTISSDQLKQRIITQMKEDGMDNTFDEESIQKIFNRVREEVSLVNTQNEFSNNGEPAEIEEIQEELNTETPVSSAIKYEVPVRTPGSIENTMEDVNFNNTEINNLPNNNTEDELPTPLKEAGKAQVVIFNQNDVSYTGENMASKTYRLLDDPDTKKTVHDFWMEKGIVVTEVFAAKFEKVGEIKFDYKTGAAYFSDIKKIEEKERIEYNNPYMPESKPEIEKISTETDLTTAIKSQIDLEAVVSKAILQILKDNLK